MIASNLLDAAVPELVQSGVADMADDCAAIGDHGDGQDTGHPVPFLAQSREAMDFVVRDRNRFAEARGDRSSLPLQASAEHAHRGVCGSSAGSLTSNAVDHHEKTAREVDVEPVLVHLALETGIGVACRTQRAHGFHQAAHRSGPSLVRYAVQT